MDGIDRIVCGLQVGGPLSAAVPIPNNRGVFLFIVPFFCLFVCAYPHPRCGFGGQESLEIGKKKLCTVPLTVIEPHRLSQATRCKGWLLR